MAGFVTLILLVAVISVEIMVFGLVGDAIGILLTIIGVFATAAIGLRLFRREGRATLSRIAEAAQRGQPPVLEMADGAAILLAAGLLLIPGYFTDLLGLVLFIPGLRSGLALLVLSALFRLLSKQAFVFRSSGHGNDPRHRRSGPFPQDQGEKPAGHPKGPASGSTIIEGQYHRLPPQIRPETRDE